jgi:dynein heavy chain
MASINMILGSRYVKPIRNEAEVWKKNLMTLSKVLDNWIFLQKQWMYLENIFAAGDIRRQLQGEAVKFDNVDKSFKKLMQQLNRLPNVMRTIKQNQNLNDNLTTYNETLDEI